jgi:hypothetical protein
MLIWIRATEFDGEEGEAWLHAVSGEVCWTVPGFGPPHLPPPTLPMGARR